MSITMTGLDDLFDVLSSPRRRAVVAYLADHRAGVDLRQLADAIGTYEAPRDASDDERSDVQQAVYVALYQSHLPKLDDYGVVEYDRRAGTITPGDRFDRVHDVLQSATRGVRSRGLVDRARSLLA